MVSSPASPDGLLFVYGSSMPGQAGYSVVERYVEPSRRDPGEGLLFDSGRGYPLAKFDPGGSEESPGLEVLGATAESGCTRMFEVHYGRALDPDGAQWFFTSEASWAEGERALLCASAP